MILTTTISKHSKKSTPQVFIPDYISYDSFKNILIIKFSDSTVKKIELSDNEILDIINAYKTKN